MVSSSLPAAAAGSCLRARPVRTNWGAAAGESRPWPRRPRATPFTPPRPGGVPAGRTSTRRRMKRVVVLAYGSGTLRSAERALARVGADVTVTSDGRASLEADGLVVPGVGAFAACMAGLQAVDGPR